MLDGCGRTNLQWEIRESMEEREVELVPQKAKEQYPEARPRLISDNGPQFIARDSTQFVRLSGMDHVRTSPSSPQSNGKIERWHGSLETEAIRPQTPLSLEDARRIVGRFVEAHNTTRLHSAIGYVTPTDRLEGRHTQIWEERDRKLEATPPGRGQFPGCLRLMRRLDTRVYRTRQACPPNCATPAEQEPRTVLGPLFMVCHSRPAIPGGG